MWPFRQCFAHVVLFKTTRRFKERPGETEAPDRLTAIEEVVKSVDGRFRRHYNIIAFPGGWFYGRITLPDRLSMLSKDISGSLLKSHKRCCVLFGVDVESNRGTDEFAVAMSYKGVLARAGLLREETKAPRVFEFGSYKICLFACDEYPLVGGEELKSIRHPDLAFVLVHSFAPRGPLKGRSYYARYNLPPISEELGCPVFAPAGFFEKCSVGEWPPGVISREKPGDRRKVTIPDVMILDHHKDRVDILEIGTALVRTFDLGRLL